MKSEGLRSWRHEGREVKQVVFYGGGRIYYSVKRGWLETCPRNLVDGVPSRHSKDVVEIFEEFVTARKENLNRTDNYVLTMSDWYDKGWAVYIYLANPPVELGEFETDRSDEKVYYKNYIEIPFRCRVKELGYTEERGTFYTEVEKDSVILETTNRSEQTDLGRFLVSENAKLQAVGIDLSSSDLKKLLEHFDIVPKTTK